MTDEQFKKLLEATRVNQQLIQAQQQEIKAQYRVIQTLSVQNAAIGAGLAEMLVVIGAHLGVRPIELSREFQEKMDEALIKITEHQGVSSGKYKRARGKATNGEQ